MIIENFLKHYFKNADKFYLSKEFLHSKRECDFFTFNLDHKDPESYESDPEEWSENFDYALKMAKARYLIIAIAISNMMIIGTEMFFIGYLRNSAWSLFLAFGVALQLFISYIQIKSYLDLNYKEASIKEYLKNLLIIIGTPAFMLLCMLSVGSAL